MQQNHGTEQEHGNIANSVIICPYLQVLLHKQEIPHRKENTAEVESREGSHQPILNQVLFSFIFTIPSAFTRPLN